MLTCQNCRWRGTSHQERTPHCTLVPCACRQGTITIIDNFDYCDLLFLVRSPCQFVNTCSSFHIPQTDCRVKGGARENQVHVWIVGPCNDIYVHKHPLFTFFFSPTWSCRAPLDCVDLLLVGGEVVHGVVPVHAPDLQRHVVAAGGQELPLRVPLDGIHLVGVALGGNFQ